MTKTAVWARIPLKPGTRDEALNKLNACVDDANTEAGTLLYILHTDSADEDAVCFYELYADGDALNSHFHGAGVKIAADVIKEFGNGPVELRMLGAVSGKGL